MKFSYLLSEGIYTFFDFLCYFCEWLDAKLAAIRVGFSNKEIIPVCKRLFWHAGNTWEENIRVSITAFTDSLALFYVTENGLKFGFYENLKHWLLGMIKQ